MKKVLIQFKDFMCTFWSGLSRRFDVTLSLRRRKKDENPLVTLNVKGEIPREVVAFFAVLGVFTVLWSIVKIIRKLS